MSWSDALEELDVRQVNPKGQALAGAAGVLGVGLLLLLAAAQQGMAGSALTALVGLAIVGLCRAVYEAARRGRRFYREMVELGKEIEAEAGRS